MARLDGGQPDGVVADVQRYQDHGIRPGIVAELGGVLGAVQLVQVGEGIGIVHRLGALIGADEQDVQHVFIGKGTALGHLHLVAVMYQAAGIQVLVLAGIDGAHAVHTAVVVAQQIQLAVDVERRGPRQHGQHHHHCQDNSGPARQFFARLFGRFGFRSFFRCFHILSFFRIKRRAARRRSQAKYKKAIPAKKVSPRARQVNQPCWMLWVRNTANQTSGITAVSASGSARTRAARLRRLPAKSATASTASTTSGQNSPPVRQGGIDKLQDIAPGQLHAVPGIGGRAHTDLVQRVGHDVLACHKTCQHPFEAPADAVARAPAEGTAHRQRALGSARAQPLPGFQQPAGQRQPQRQDGGHQQVTEGRHRTQGHQPQAECIAAAGPGQYPGTAPHRPPQNR